MNEKLILENQHAIMKALALIDGEISQKDYELLKNQIGETEDYLNPKESSLTDKTENVLNKGCGKVVSGRICGQYGNICEDCLKLKVVKRGSDEK